MKRLVTALALLLFVTPAIALERSPEGRGHLSNGGSGQQTVSERGDRFSGKRDGYAGRGERVERSGGDERSSRSYFQRERGGGQRGERN